MSTNLQCQSPQKNRLANEPSPYLQKHAENPVNWYPWGEEALSKAKKENKPILVSIGYSSCHWCHVMEEESFMDEEVAKLMNEHFVCIKIDREERPDIDDIYMTAVQMMTGSGGWPLNCFATPDKKPFWGGTYFPKKQWKNILSEIAKAWEQKPDKIQEQAETLSEGLTFNPTNHKDEIEVLLENDFLEDYVGTWSKSFDLEHGGRKGFPKFPIPNNLLFLLRYAVANNDTSTEQYVSLTLNQMARGGIYDQIGGGFARYSTDDAWKVPHFEKMLYDNAQLLYLYSEAYQYFKYPLYKRVVEETFEFLTREMLHENGGFYSAIDADSEGEEGKFYVWKTQELKTTLGENYKRAKDYFGIGEQALWEHGNNILLLPEPDETFISQQNLSPKTWAKKRQEIRKTLFEARKKRVHPLVDTKILMEWNALMVSALFKAYETFGNETYKKQAEKTLSFLLKKMTLQEEVYRVYKDKKYIKGFSSDYVFLIDALIHAVNITFDDGYYFEAKKLFNYVLKHFYDPEINLLRYKNSNETYEISVNNPEIYDNVIPASNSVFSNLLQYFSVMEGREYKEMNDKMLKQILPQMRSNPGSFSNWGISIMHKIFPKIEVVVVGKNYQNIIQELKKEYRPNIILAGAKNETSKHPLLTSRYVEGKTLIYVCSNNTCKFPVSSIEEAKKLIRETRVSFLKSNK